MASTGRLKYHITQHFFHAKAQKQKTQRRKSKKRKDAKAKNAKTQNLKFQCFATLRKLCVLAWKKYPVVRSNIRGIHLNGKMVGVVAGEG